jgi:hypothetical protein
MHAVASGKFAGSSTRHGLPRILREMDGRNESEGVRGSAGWRRVGMRALAVAIASSAWLWAGAAQAAPLGSWCIGLERLFGASWTNKSYDYEYDGRTVQHQRTLSVLPSRAPEQGYSAPRLGLDYVAASGLSAGGAFGVDAMVRGSSYSGPEYDANANSSSIAVVLAPRLGFFLHPLPWLGVWPRLGLTYLVLTRGDDRLAITLDVPVALLLADDRLGLMLAPYLDGGLPEDRGDNLVEYGILASVGIFF